jgi:alkylation response protein AidB-like acyl-CoA dehydrogenase
VAAVAAVQALGAYRWCAQKCIQILGGIGYTWEHDAHLYLRRAATLTAVFGGRDVAAEVSALVRAGVECGHDVELPPEAETYRAEARALRARLDTLPATERRAALIDSGYLVPHWPRPWGRGADAVEQLVLDEDLAGVEGPDLGIGSWVLLTLVQTASPEQLDRWIRPSLEGAQRWCQLFSEPGAGSDAAAISTRATRVEGGWLVNGQKVWTSDAMTSTMGLATVRTDPDAPKHAGVTAMAIDMRAPGVEVRPLREITGETLFNEVFFDDVFVPDEDVVGEVNQGWAVARATLGNERVSIGSNQSDLGLPDARELVAIADRYAPGDQGAAREVGVLIAEAQALTALNLRHVMRALVGGPPGPEGNITKLCSAEHAQRVAGLGLDLAGGAGAGGGEPRLARAYLFSRCLTIAGGTSEIVRNVIAERILGLPRDPLAR